MQNATSPCLDSFCRLDRLGLTVTGQIVGLEHSVLMCVPTTPATPCPDCAEPGRRHDTVVQNLAHVPFGWKPTILSVGVPIAASSAGGCGVTIGVLRPRRGGIVA